MATTIGTEYDHIDITNGVQTIRHPLKDASARENLVKVQDTFSDLKSAFDDLDTQMNGDHEEKTEVFEVTWNDGYYIDYSSGAIYQRSNSSASSLIELPDNVKKITVTGSADTISGGYAFYTANNYSYFIENSGASLRNGTDLVTVEIRDIPADAKYFAFTTLPDNKANSGASCVYVEYDPTSEGIASKVSALENTLSEFESDIEEISQDISGLPQIEEDINALDETVNGTGGGSRQHTDPISVVWSDGSYIDTTNNGKGGPRSGYSRTSPLIAIPSNAESLTIKGTSGINASGYWFYTKDNVSYGIAESGGTLKNVGEVTVEIPETATHVGFSTQNADISNSGLWYTWTEVTPGDGGLIGDVEDLQEKAEAVDEMLSPCVDKSSTITWTNGYRIIRIYGVTESSAYKIGRFSANRGDRIIIDHSEEIPRGTVLVSEEITIAGGTSHKPLVPEIPASHVEYIVPQDMEIAISVKTASLTNLKWYAMPVNNDALDTTDNQTVVFPWGKVTNIMSASRKNPMSEGARKQRPLVLAHISDIHNNRNNSKSFRDFLKMFGGYIDDAIITGDMAGSKYPDYIPIWEQTGYNNVLLTIGNHDVYDYAGTHGSSDYYNREYFATEKQTYDQYFAPSISNWNVTQPENASTNGYCYYYKDYSLIQNADSTTVNTIRLIVLNPMHYNATQHTWLETTLTDARTSGYPVVIAEHFIPMETLTDMNLFDTPFSSLMPGMRDYFGLYFLSYVDGSKVRHKAADLVDSFITNGGEFVCWICGHEHFDMVGTLASHPNQIFIAVGTASAYPANAYADMPREYGTESENLINVFSVDTYNKTIRVGRVGATIDDHMRHRGGICIDYANRLLLHSW